MSLICALSASTSSSVLKLWKTEVNISPANILYTSLVCAKKLLTQDFHEVQNHSCLYRVEVRYTIFIRSTSRLSFSYSGLVLYAGTLALRIGTKTPSTIFFFNKRHSSKISAVARSPLEPSTAGNTLIHESFILKFTTISSSR